jgi:cytochrome P450
LIADCRAPGYDVAHPPDVGGNLNTLTDPAEHNKRRRVWDRAFTPAAVKGYEPMLATRISQLISCLDARTGEAVDITQWISFCAMDFMGDFAFSNAGGAFDLLQSEKDSTGLRDAAASGTAIMDVFSKIPWTQAIIHSLPNPKMDRVMANALAIVEKRKATGSQTRDLFSYLVRCSSIASLVCADFNCS